MLIDGKSIFDLAKEPHGKQKSTIPSDKFKLSNHQEAKNYLDFNANILFLQYLLPKLVQCKQLEIPIAISIFAKKEKKKDYAMHNALIGYEKDLYIIDVSQFEPISKRKLLSSERELPCDLVELSSFLLESGLDVNFTFLSDDEVKIRVSKTLEKKQENPVLCKKSQ